LVLQGNADGITNGTCFFELFEVGGIKNRKFVINRGTFDVRNREWDADFIEII